MRVNRVFVDAPLQVGLQVRLPDAAVAHLVRVLRAGAGDACVVFNGDGCDYAARISSIGKRGTVVDIDGCTRIDNESPLRIVLLQALARGAKMDLVLQKATELGVAAFVPVVSDRSEVRLEGERLDKRTGHWRSVVTAACEQCGRAVVPSVALPMPMSAALEQLAANAQRLWLDPAATQGASAIAPLRDDTIVIAIGPEGGWSPRDRQVLGVGGFIGMRLGPRILRTETAGLAAIAALQSRYGDLG
jgi:16S rRNA (uracil1498-N3)-methyltransferase